MPLPEIELKQHIDDGTEHRHVLVRTRDGDIMRLVDAIGNGGFSRASAPRLTLLDEGKLMISILTNTGKSGEYIALAIDIFVPLTKEELEVLNPKLPPPEGLDATNQTP